MRIIAGEKRGMKLLGPPPPLLRFAKQSGGRSRPITDRVKESLFNVLYKYDLPPLLSSTRRRGGKIVADLFCGVGSLGLEALSRGASSVTFVEQNPKVIAILKKNIEKASFVKKSKVIRANAFKVSVPAGERKYDLIFVDPPYASTSDVKKDSPLGRLLISTAELLTPDGIAVVRTERQTELLNQYGLMCIIERRQWGTMAVTILQKKSDEQ